MSSSIKGYRAVLVPLSEDVSHCFYLKEHGEKNQKGGTLFVGNVDISPLQTSEELDQILRTVFSVFGTIDSVSVSDFGSVQRDKSRFAHVTFSKKSSVKLALSGTQTDFADMFSQALRDLAIDMSYRPSTNSQIRKMFPLFDMDAKELQEEVDSYMVAFEGEEAQRRKEDAIDAGVADEDGFVTVKAKKRTRGAEELQSEAAKSKAKKKNKDKELKNFYRFQVREDKMKQLDQLRKKFDEDKKKVERMKAARKFNPF